MFPEGRAQWRTIRYWIKMSLFSKQQFNWALSFLNQEFYPTAHSSKATLLERSFCPSAISAGCINLICWLSLIAEHTEFIWGCEDKWQYWCWQNWFQSPETQHRKGCEDTDHLEWLKKWSKLMGNKTICKLIFILWNLVFLLNEICNKIR